MKLCRPLCLCWIFLLCIALPTWGQPELKIARLKYGGGGDWYSNKSALPNLIRFCNENLKTRISDHEEIADVGSADLFSYPFIYMTGHGNVRFDKNQAKNLRDYLVSGGFLHIDDNYGLDPFIRVEMKKVFPEKEFKELGYDHPIYHQMYSFPSGPPKVHEHDGEPPQGYGIFHEGRLVCYYTHEADLGNGWEDGVVYGNPEPIRIRALQMGANILSFVFCWDE